MGALVAIATWAITNGPMLIQLGVNIAPVAIAAKDAITALVSGNHIDDAAAADLRAKVQVLEDAWAVEVQKAQKEVAQQG